MAAEDKIIRNTAVNMMKKNFFILNLPFQTVIEKNAPASII
jgi:hypothetical protein